MTELVQASSSEAEVAPAALADCSPQQRIEDRYVAALNDLLEHAWDNKSMVILVDCMTWSLARVTLLYPSTGTAGDILQRLGRHLCDLTERREAADEAERAKKEGVMPH